MIFRVLRGVDLLKTRFEMKNALMNFDLINKKLKESKLLHNS